MAEEVVGFGLTIYSARDQRLSSATVVTVAGAYTTAIITRTFPLDAISACLLTVNYNSYTLLCTIIMVHKGKSSSYR